MSYNINQHMSRFLQETGKRMAFIYRVTRTDGTIYRFTSHNKTIVLGAESFVPGSGFDVQARTEMSGLEPPNSSLIGVLSDSSISEADVRSGLFERAVIEEKCLDWQYPFAGYFFENTYEISRISRDADTWRAELVGMAQKLGKRVGHVASKYCPYQLGDSTCRINLESASYKFALDVLTAYADSELNRQRFVVDTNTLTEDFVAHGKLKWTTGLNTGLWFDILSFNASTEVLQMKQRTPYTIAASDAFIVYAGCDKTIQTCRDKFSNEANFGGEPFMPGRDDFIPERVV